MNEEERDKRNARKRTVAARARHAAADAACGAFLAEAAEFGEKFETRAGEFHRRCLEFCARTGREAPSVRAFGLRMRRRLDVRKTGKKGRVTYLGARALKFLDGRYLGTEAAANDAGDGARDAATEIPKPEGA